MTKLTVRAGASGAMEELVFGAPGASPEGADRCPSPYDYLLMAVGA